MSVGRLLEVGCQGADAAGWAADGVRQDVEGGDGVLAAVVVGCREVGDVRLAGALDED